MIKVHASWSFEGMPRQSLLFKTPLVACMETSFTAPSARAIHNPFQFKSPGTGVESEPSRPGERELYKGIASHAP